MAWTSTKTFSSGDILTAADMNTYLSGNTDALKNPPSANYELDEGSDYTTTSTTFVDVDATNLSLTITTTGGDVMIGFHGTVYNNAGVWTYIDVTMDGVRIGGDDGIAGLRTASQDYPHMSFVRLKTGVSAGAHTFKLQWKTSSGSTTLYAGAGTANFDWHSQFFVREVS